MEVSLRATFAAHVEGDGTVVVPGKLLPDPVRLLRLPGFIVPGMDLARRLAVARGDEPADLVVRGGHVFSAFTREWLDTDVAIVDGVVAGLGDYDGDETLDADGRWVVPGFIDAHMHLESVKLLVDEFARLVLPLGTTAVVADPHEIANVLGVDGVHWLLDASAGLQLEVFFMAPSCVPASPFEAPRRPLGPGDLEALMRRRRVLGLAEMMNFPGVIGGSAAELAKLSLEGAGHVDGHAPGVVGRELQAYAAAGIASDHEALTVEEGRERLRAGMWLLVREASMARNLRALLPLARQYGPGRIAFCTDDRDPEDIADDGHVNAMVREAVAAGIPPEDALLMASLHPAQWHGLARHGAIAPAYQADLLLLPDLERFVPDVVLKRGRPLEDVAPAHVPDWVRQTVRIRPVTASDFAIRWAGGKARVIGLIPEQVVTQSLVREPAVRDGCAVADSERDLAKIAVVERHLATGRIGLGFVTGSGLRRGALASTVAHDAHNLVAVGMDDEDLAFAVERLAEIGGGIVAVDGRRVLAECPLPVAGLLSDAPLETVIAQSRACNEAAADLGWSGATPFLTLAFLALSVIPSLKITDRGLVDVDRFELVPLEA
ncbi:MAG TPA: adenine deaminase [Gaiellaceae bacterium]|nr:adenine deaminase [Gaiellaceae bacterium]